MRLILTEAVRDLIGMSIDNPTENRIFLEPMYLREDSTEPSWTLLQDDTGQRMGIELKGEGFSIWCAQQYQDSLHNKILMRHGEKGFIAVPGLVLEATAG